MCVSVCLSMRAAKRNMYIIIAKYKVTDTFAWWICVNHPQTTRGGVTLQALEHTSITNGHLTTQPHPHYHYHYLYLCVYH